MLIKDILSAKPVTFSCELFPPKVGTDLEKAVEGYPCGLVDPILPQKPASVKGGGPDGSIFDILVAKSLQVGVATIAKIWYNKLLLYSHSYFLL